MNNKKIGFVCVANPFVDRKAISGVLFMERKAIEHMGYEVIWIPYQTNSWKIRFYTKILEFRRKMFGENYLRGHHYKPFVKEYAKTVNLEIVNKCDLLFFPACGQMAPYIKTNKPIIYNTDATVHLILDYYWLNISNNSKKMAKRLEERACRRATINTRASQWAIDSVITDCKCNPDHCHVLEFGPGIDEKDIFPNKPYINGEFNILFSGTNWVWKGGHIAVETFKILRENGINAKLFIAGIRTIPDECIGVDNIVFCGFMDKNNPDDYQRYINLYKKCHIFLLPTKAEAAGVVFCEANAFGIPSYTYATGGTTSYVIDGYNGRALPERSRPSDFAQAIISDIHYNRIVKYNRNALTLSRDKLSWDSWGRRLSDIIESEILISP